MHPSNYYHPSKFRGSSKVVCVWAFGLFFVLGGALMIYLAYLNPATATHSPPFWMQKSNTLNSIPPIQVAGPILFLLGCLLLLIGLCASITTSQFLNEKLRHHHHQGQPASVVVYTTHFRQPRAVYERNPSQPLPPPAHPVLHNPYAHSSLLNPDAEMKLFPPVMPGHSTLTLHGGGTPSTVTYIGSPYNTLRAVSANRYSASVEPPLIENSGALEMGGSRRQSMNSVGQHQRRAVSSSEKKGRG